MEQKSSKKLILIVSCILVVLIAASVAAYAIWKDSLAPDNPTTSSQPTDTSSVQKFGKNISVVINVGENEYRFGYDTEAQFLREALEDVDLIKGEESEYGLFVTEVYGFKVDKSKRQWWQFFKNGEELMTGVDTTPVANGDVFEIKLGTY